MKANDPKRRTEDRKTRKWIWALVPALLILALICNRFCFDRVAFPFEDVADQVDLHYSPMYHFDLGVADLNSDSFLDIFTVNCFCRQNLLINQGDGTFSEQLAAVGLSQDNRAPSFECMPANQVPEKIDLPGLHIYNISGGVDAKPPFSQIISWRKGEGVSGVRGSVSLYSKPALVEATATSVKITTQPSLTSLSKHTLAFQAEPGAKAGRIVFRPALPPIIAVHYHYEITITGGCGNQAIYLGRDAVNPASSNFQLTLGDRHGFAWADYDKSGSVDLFIARGGMRGKLGEYQKVEKYNDELFRNEAGFLTDVAEEAGIIKTDGRSRQSMWVDVNQDGFSDLYILNYQSANQLYLNLGDGTFREAAREFGLDMTAGDVAAWLDYDQDGDPDLVIGGFTDLLYVNQEGAFRPVVLKKVGLECLDMTIGDFDNDLDQDLWITHRKRSPGARVEGTNHLFENNGSTFEEILNLKQLGLSKTGLGAAWVDFDNDGCLDIYIAGEGIFRNQGGSTFTRTGLLTPAAWRRKSMTREFFCWFDADNNGYPDLVSVKEFGRVEFTLRRFMDRIGLGSRNPPMGLLDKLRYHYGFYRNQNQGNNWLALVLQGTRSNSEGTGAKIYLTAGGMKQYREAGFNGRIYRSQSSERVHFGLSDLELVESVEVVWPSGIRQVVTKIKANQILSLQEPPDTYQ